VAGRQPAAGPGVPGLLPCEFVAVGGVVDHLVVDVFQDDLRRRCVPGPSRPATDVAELIRRGGTLSFIFVLARVHETKGLELEQMTGEAPVPAASALAGYVGH
jgi:hypothetical protein